MTRVYQLFTNPSPHGFLSGRTSTDEEAHTGFERCCKDLLWRDWRTSLPKDLTPGDRVLITHGQPELHWWREASGTLCVDLGALREQGVVESY